MVKRGFGIFVLINFIMFFSLINGGCIEKNNVSEQKQVISNQSIEINGLQIKVNYVHSSRAFKLNRVYNDSSGSFGGEGDRVTFIDRDGELYDMYATKEGEGIMNFGGYSYIIKYHDNPIEENDEWINVKKEPNGPEDVVYKGEFISFLYDLIEVNISSSVVSGILTKAPENSINPGITSGFGEKIENLTYLIDIVSGNYTSAIIKIKTYCDEKVCVENWTCGNWSNCSNNQQTRICTDNTNCGTNINKPSISQSCFIEGCNENWECSNWGECIDNKKTRGCTEKNSCNTTLNKPSTSKTCDLEINQNKSIEIITINKTENVTKNIIKYYIKDKEIKVEKEKIKINDEYIKSSLKIISKEEKIYVKTDFNGEKEIRILPEEAVSKADKIEKVNSIEIGESKGKAVYIIKGIKKARLIFIIPITAEVEQNINVEDGEIISVKKPWWSFLAFGI